MLHARAHFALPPENNCRVRYADAPGYCPEREPVSLTGRIEKLDVHAVSLLVRFGDVNGLPAILIDRPPQRIDESTRDEHRSPAVSPVHLGRSE